jgi:hypothetical protein
MDLQMAFLFRDFGGKEKGAVIVVVRGRAEEPRSMLLGSG